MMAGVYAALALLSGIMPRAPTGAGQGRRCQPVRHRAVEPELPRAWYLNEGHVQGREPRSAHPSLTPSQLYRTEDGWIFIMCNKHKFWPVLCAKLGRPPGRTIRDSPHSVTGGKIVPN